MLWLAMLLPALPLQVFTRSVREAPPLAILSPPLRRALLPAWTLPAWSVATIRCSGVTLWRTSTRASRPAACRGRKWSPL